MLGVLPKHENKGIAFRLKMEQKKFALQYGYRVVKWTFDPLLSKNAYLNLKKLGAILRTYVENIYGNLHDQFNRGLPTDRFVVEWFVEESAQKAISDRKLQVNDSVCVESAVFNTLEKANFRIPGKSRFTKLPRIVSLEIPYDFLHIKKTSLSVSRQWRKVTRKNFVDLFRKGYVAFDFRSIDFGKEKRSFYLLERNPHWLKYCRY